MTDFRELAELLLPEVKEEPGDIYQKYPSRNLPASAMVTRFAPSPTGMLHIGHLYAALVFARLAHQSEGVVYLRIEDTDQKRECEGSVAGIIDSLQFFEICFDEGQTGMDSEVGNYGPYQQSLRADIYKVFVKALLKSGLAYPCFCSEAELDEIRTTQRSSNTRLGYFGTWAKHRQFTLDQVKAEIANGRKWVIRFKSPGDETKRIRFVDLIKGPIEMPENDQDIVILKSDGLPTYHFAHAIDDFLMGTTHVLRADEWLPSVPLHLQLFASLGFPAPYYGHIAPLLKQDGNSKRKFSKRKDPDAAVNFYREQGYPGQAVGEYCLHLINSNFEEWRAKHPGEPYADFKISFEKMNPAGALFDLGKLNDYSKNIIASYSAEMVYDLAVAWAKEYDRELFQFMTQSRDYTFEILRIGRGTAKPRKDLTKWSDIRQVLGFFYDEIYLPKVQDGYDFSDGIPVTKVYPIIHSFLMIYDTTNDQATWFGKIKNTAERLGYAKDEKTLKQNPDDYQGSIADYMMVIRIALTNQTTTPELHQVMQVMGEDRVKFRLQKCLHRLTEIN